MNDDIYLDCINELIDLFMKGRVHLNIDKIGYVGNKEYYGKLVQLQDQFLHLLKEMKSTT